MLGYCVIQSHTEKEKIKSHQDMLAPDLNNVFDKLLKTNPKKKD